MKETEKDNSIASKKKEPKRISMGYLWAIKITLITLVLSIVVSFITEITSTKSNVVVSILVLFLLILVSVLFDAIGVAATSCDIAPLLAMASKKVRGASQAVKLVKNAGKVSNICADVIGDMCGIISGSCCAAIVLMFAINNPHEYLFNILASSIVAALTVGGKAFFKNVAIKRSKEMMLFVGRILSLFSRKK